MSSNRSTQWLAGVAVLLLAALVGPSTSAAQALRPQPKPQRSRIAPPLGRADVRHASGRIAFAMVGEVEPNDSISIATPAALGDTISGLIDPTGDVDFFSLELTAGTHLILDVDASQYGSSLDPILGLFDVDGVTMLYYSDDWDGLDSHIDYVIPVTGRYYVGIMDFSAGGGAGYFYALKVFEFVQPPPGPGDPTTPFASGLVYPVGMTVAANGDIYVADPGASAIARVNAAGTVSTFVSQLPSIYDVVFDGYGDLLAASADSGVWRITPGGTRSRFAAGISATAVTVDAGGDVWVAGYVAGDIRVWRYDSRGGLKATIDANAMGFVADLAFSPSGELFATNDYDGVFRITASGPQAVISSLQSPEGLAFDRDGYLYVASYFPSEIHLFDASLHEIGSSFAHDNLSGPIMLAFGRSSSGAMTPRLFATNGGYAIPTDFPGAILEVNPAGVRAAGFRIGVTRPSMPVTAVSNAFLGEPGAVSAEVAEFLDHQGNGNGRLDVADFRVYLRSIAPITTSNGRTTP